MSVVTIPVPNLYKSMSERRSTSRKNIWGVVLPAKISGA